MQKFVHIYVNIIVSCVLCIRRHIDNLRSLLFQIRCNSIPICQDSKCRLLNWSIHSWALLCTLLSLEDATISIFLGCIIHVCRETMAYCTRFLWVLAARNMPQMCIYMLVLRLKFQASKGGQRTRHWSLGDCFVYVLHVLVSSHTQWGTCLLKTCVQLSQGYLSG